MCGWGSTSTTALHGTHRNTRRQRLVPEGAARRFQSRAFRSAARARPAVCQTCKLVQGACTAAVRCMRHRRPLLYITPSTLHGRRCWPQARSHRPALAPGSMHSLEAALDVLEVHGPLVLEHTQAPQHALDHQPRQVVLNLRGGGGSKRAQRQAEASGICSVLHVHAHACMWMHGRSHVGSRRVRCVAVALCSSVVGLCTERVNLNEPPPSAAYVPWCPCPQTARSSCLSGGP